MQFKQFSAPTRSLQFHSRPARFSIFYLVALLFKRLARKQFVLAIALEAAWEVFENSSFVIDRYRTATAALGYQGDTVVNWWAIFFVR